ncbi:MAG TPA: HAMP domain-containing sensor histidine kinase [bacterium]|jgi:signal transduction histidine kinase
MIAMIPKSRFSRYFGLNFILLEILIVGGSGVVSYGLGRNRMLDVSSQTSAAVANHLARSLDQFYMAPWELTFATYPFDNPIANEELVGVVRTFVNGFNVEKVSIYDKHYRILFSTDSTMQGKEEPSNSMLFSALAGHAVSKLIKEYPAGNTAGVADMSDHLLAYVPVEVRAGTDSTERLAFAMLMDVSAMYAKVRQLRNVIILSTAATGLALFLVVWLIAARADRIITEENRERMVLAERIRKQNDELETIVAQRTQELRSTQAGMVQMEKMAATGQLAAGVAHEINNPVGNIQNRLELLLDDVHAGRPVDDLEAHLAMMHRNTGRISNIVGRLLSFARQSGTGKMPLNLSTLLSGVLLLTRKEIEKRGIALDVNIPEDLPPFKGNSTEIEQVFINLLVNAMDATPRGGSITLTAQAKGESLHVQITDSGQGIAPEYLSKIFDPFFTTKDVGVGTGLGLSITYRIVENHDGNILVSSEIGKGTTFVVRFPVLEKQVQAT